MKLTSRLHSPALARWMRTLQSQWLALSIKERRQIIVLAFLVSVTLIWLLAVRPALQARQHWQQELPRLHRQAAELEQLLQRRGQSPATAPPAARPWAALLQDSLEHAGLNAHIRVVDPDIHLDFAAATSASDLIGWLVPASERLGLSVQHVRMERLGTVGRPAPEPEHIDQLDAPVTALVQLQIRQQPWDGPSHDTP